MMKGLKMRLKKRYVIATISLFLLKNNVLAFELLKCDFDKTIVNNGTIKSKDFISMFLLQQAGETFFLAGTIDNPIKVPTMAKETSKSMSYFWTNEENAYLISINRTQPKSAVLAMNVYTQNSFAGTQRSGQCMYQVF